VLTAEESWREDVTDVTRILNAIERGDAKAAVISTCHGGKGEEYDTVIAFGLLKGYIPNWPVIIHADPKTANDRTSKLLYVICSRAGKHLYLIAESGRFTQRRDEYETTPLLESVEFDYDSAS